MKLDDYEEINSSSRVNVSVAGLICILAMLTIVGIVIATNKSKSVKTNSTKNSIIESISEETSVTVSSYASFLKEETHVSDLDFYDMYPKEETSVSSVLVSEETNEEEQTDEVDETNDGKHTKIIWQDGSEEWIAISPYLPKNEYELTNLINRSGIMEYYDNDKITSTFGVDISKDNDYIDFYKLAKSGVDFVMIRLGARGYSTGQLIIDDYFLDNIKRANDAGLMIGIYFISQAITEKEAEEEADLVLENIKNYNITYPVCYLMQYMDNESSRVEILDRSEKTSVAIAFLDKIKEAGYNPMIYGTKLWLLKYLDLSKLVFNYDIWLSQPEETLPDFPYKFAMWQYNKMGSVEGIKGTVNCNVCFTDFSIK